MTVAERKASMIGIVAVPFVFGGFALAGDFTPPAGPVGATMKSLETIEPRIPVGPDTTPGDATAVFVISAPGSYYLTGDVIGQADEDGIRIDRSDVSLDLNGFAVRGTPTSGVGIKGAVWAHRLCIENGVVSGWGSTGIDGDQAFESNYDNLLVVDNGEVGLIVGGESTVRDCRALRNALDGFNVNGGASFDGCHATDNGGNGFCAGGSLIARSCQAYENTASGFSAGRGTYTDCTSAGNGYAGFELSPFSEGGGASRCEALYNSIGFVSTFPVTLDHCRASHNTADGFAIVGGVVDACVAFLNSDDGFQLGGGVVVNGCQSRDNSYGFYVPGTESKVRVDTCSASSNGFTGFLVAGTDCLVVRNMAHGNFSDYSFLGSGQYGAVITSTGTIATDPWANFAGPPKALATDDPNLARKEAEAAAWHEEIERRRMERSDNPTGATDSGASVP